MLNKEAKQTLRKECLKKRSALDETTHSKYDARCHELLFRTEEYQKATSLLLYISYNHEVDTFQIIKQAMKDGKRVAAPKVIGQKMEFYYFNDIKELSKGAYGILEPQENGSCIEEYSLMIMPLVGFDEACHRIGYGGGFYDRYLHTHTVSTKLALAYECQKVSGNFFEEHDIAPDKIITEERIYKK